MPSDPVRLRAYARELEDLVAAIVEGHDPLVSGEEGRRTTAMLDAGRAIGRQRDVRGSRLIA